MGLGIALCVCVCVYVCVQVMMYYFCKEECVKWECLCVCEVFVGL